MFFLCHFSMVKIYSNEGSEIRSDLLYLQNVLPLEKQVENFRLYKARLAKQFGHETANNTVSQALFAISGGTDDFANNYFLNHITRKKYNVEQFQDLMLKSLTVFIEVKVFSYTSIVSFLGFRNSWSSNKLSVLLSECLQRGCYYNCHCWASSFWLFAFSNYSPQHCRKYML